MCAIPMNYWCENSKLMKIIVRLRTLSVTEWVRVYFEKKKIRNKIDFCTFSWFFFYTCERCSEVISWFSHCNHTLMESHSICKVSKIFGEKLYSQCLLINVSCTRWKMIFVFIYLFFFECKMATPQHVLWLQVKAVYRSENSFSKIRSV